MQHLYTQCPLPFTAHLQKDMSCLQISQSPLEFMEWTFNSTLLLTHMSELKNSKSVLLVLSSTYALLENIYSVCLIVC